MSNWTWAIVFTLLTLTGAVVMRAQAQTSLTTDQELSRALDLQSARSSSPLQAYVSSWVASNGTDVPVVAPSPQIPAQLCVNSSCLYTGTATYKITGQPKANPANGTGTNSSYNVDRGSLVLENLVSIRVDNEVSMAVGGEQRSRCELYTYRIDSQTSVRLTGVNDCGAITGFTGVERDTGGCNPAQPISCVSTGGTQIAPDATETTVTLVCKPVAGQSCVNPTTGATPAPISGDTYVKDAWTNGNATGSGWGSP